MAALLFGILAAGGSAGSGADARDRAAPAQETIMPLSRVLPSVRRAAPGHVMSARLRGSTYFIRILTQRGDVVVVRADGRSGRILDVQGR